MKFVLPGTIGAMNHRERIMAKRKFYGNFRDTTRPFGLIELLTDEQRRDRRMPHQGAKERARRLAKMGGAS